MNKNIKNNIEYLTFNNLSSINYINHLFSTRIGGVSTGHLSSMNLSYTRGDDKTNVDENFRRIANIIGCDMNDFVTGKQTHTTNVRTVTLKDAGKGVTRELDYDDTDGLITNVPGIVLVTYYADCVPLFFVDTKNKAIGLSHSGWRGTVNRMGEATLKAMAREYGTSPADVVCAIGPCICQDCYEVSEDVASEFQNAFTNSKELLIDKNNGKYQLDLVKANETVLVEAGINNENIELPHICTCCNPEYLFSHRATGGKRGNLAAFLSIK